MKFIEFFGMPASGKTYFVKNLEKNSYNLNKLNLFFAFNKRSIRSFINKIYYLLLSIFLFFNFSYLNKIVYFFINTYKPRRSRKISLRTLSIIFNTCFLISIISIYTNARKNISIYLDQGFFQILFSILYEMNLRNLEENESLIKKWVEIISLHNQTIYLIYIESDNSLIFERLLNRKGDSIIEKNKIKKIDIKLYQNIFDIILELLITKEDDFPNIQVQRISSDTKNINLLNL